MGLRKGPTAKRIPLARNAITENDSATHQPKNTPRVDIDAPL